MMNDVQVLSVRRTGRPSLSSGERTATFNASMPLQLLEDLHALITDLSTSRRECNRSEIGRMSVNLMAEKDFDGLLKSLIAYRQALEKVPRPALRRQVLAYRVQTSHVNRINLIADSTAVTALDEHGGRSSKSEIMCAGIFELSKMSLQELKTRLTEAR